MGEKFSVRFVTDNMVNDRPVHVTVPGTPKPQKGFGTQMARTIEGGERRLMIPGTTLRGGVRRSACEYAIPPGTMDLLTAQMNLIGGVKGSGKAGMTSEAAKIDFVNRNPIVRLFGCGEPAFISGRARIMDAIATNPAPMIGDREYRKGRRGDVVGDGEYLPSPEEAVRLRAAEVIYPVKLLVKETNDVLAKEARRASSAADKLNLKMEAITKIRNAVEPEFFRKHLPEDLVVLFLEGDTKKLRDFDLKKIIDALDNSIKAVGMSTVRSRQILEGVEVMPAGSVMCHSMEIMQADKAAIGLFVMAMHNKSLRDPAIGGKKATGMGGNLRAGYAVTVLSPGAAAWSDMGVAEMTPFGGFDVSSVPFLLDCIDAWNTLPAAQKDYSYPTDLLDAVSVAAEGDEATDEGDSDE